MTLVLASQSPARLATLRAAGIDPAVRVSHVDEDRLLADAAARPGGVAPVEAVLLLARAKAETVVADLAARPLDPTEAPDAPRLVVGCDSMLELDGEVLGKPRDADDARRRWHAMRGRTGVLHTGHWVVAVGERPRDEEQADDPGHGPAARGATSSTTVHFADVSDAEVDAYVATGEPLHVAGAFTTDGLGGAFVRGIEGDHHGVVGISLPLLRELVGALGVLWTDLWSDRVRP
ncbi:septum formation protein [Sediminihabitans luteus]|uniref:Nucleoside triphosphate pyrophosphatase n=1 Tax=Sediminihabitans luteus TaxID=1138585 RepID=A0A2M9CYH2_9CELL|nr:nucleoside triphosphate pyrophosphatase [Sediminihabitans luteus]PJJ76960.1 septum formation protein [Sediminihabitans luteus]GII99601.1 Maf-like protein [Sediminihabitans luteus]